MGWVGGGDEVGEGGDGVGGERSGSHEGNRGGHYKYFIFKLCCMKKMVLNNTSVLHLV